ncbi:hypothetical protein TNCV_4586791 [Trichonephila clavipes]|nr:hypothetical protein TNCV_4586791 [Trichonephila clavipes]
MLDRHTQDLRGGYEDAQHYSDEVLGAYVRLFPNPMRSDNIFIDDLNPIIWDDQGWPISQQNTSPRTPLELKVSLLEEQALLPHIFINTLINSMTARFNGDRYRAMITNFFIPEWNNHDVQELWFQQDGATCHTARATIDLLKDTFGDRLISRFGPVNWPPRSCDLTTQTIFCEAM